MANYGKLGPTGAMLSQKTSSLDDEHGEFKAYKEMRVELDLDGRCFHQGWLTHQSGEVWRLTAEQACMHLGRLNLITCVA